MIAAAATLAVACVVLLALVWRQRGRLAMYESQGAARVVSQPYADGACPQCSGRLVPAVMDDDVGPALRVAVDGRVYADGRPVFLYVDLDAAETARAEHLRGAGPGAWCWGCREFYPRERGAG